MSSQHRRPCISGITSIDTASPCTRAGDVWAPLRSQRRSHRTGVGGECRIRRLREAMRVHEAASPHGCARRHHHVAVRHTQRAQPAWWGTRSLQSATAREHVEGAAWWHPQPTVSHREGAGYLEVHGRRCWVLTRRARAASCFDVTKAISAPCTVRDDQPSAVTCGIDGEYPTDHSPRIPSSPGLAGTPATRSPI
jgi:hypothetical protein